MLLLTGQTFEARLRSIYSTVWEIVEHSIEKYFHFSCIGQGRGEAFPAQAWTGPEGSRRLRLPDFKAIGT
jgi:hypothetical protein